MNVNRTKSRRQALIFLYQCEINKTLNVEKGFETFNSKYSTGNLNEFTYRLIKGVLQNLNNIDTAIEKVSLNWRIDRMSIVDRNIIRLGVFELFYCDDIPTTVTINEMVELAKRYGDEGSSAFVNGILDKIKEFINCPNKAP